MAADLALAATTRTAAALLLALAVFFDVQERRIPNVVSFCLLALALGWAALAPHGAGLFSAAFSGSTGISGAMLSAAVAFAVFFLFYLFRFTGAGDVKLATAVAAFFPLSSLPGLLLAILLAGGVLALVRMINPERRATLWRNLVSIGLSALATGSTGSTGSFDAKSQTADRLPFAVAIAGGAIGLALATYFDY